MMQIISHLKATYQFHSNGIYRFGPKIKLHFDVGPYTVKTAQTRKELLECFRLRDEVFNIEFRSIESQKYDFDQFDAQCDHIIIVHKETKKIVGTYRLNSSLHSKSFYTESEFDIRHLKYLKGPILELGRACIHKDHRRGGVISLLWKGIAEYMNLSNAQTLFGCSSIKVTDSRDAALIYQYLAINGHIDPRYCVKPQPNYEMHNFAVWLEYFQESFSDSLAEEAEKLIPSLLKSYLKIGAKIISEPALDTDFNCVDLLTLLQREKLSKSAEKKYGVEPTAVT